MVWTPVSSWLHLRSCQDQVRQPRRSQKTSPQNQENSLRDRSEWHYTPECGSRLNIAEIELFALKRQCLRSRLSDSETVRRKVTAWQTRRNGEPTRIDWRCTAEDARIQLKRLYPVVDAQ